MFSRPDFPTPKAISAALGATFRVEPVPDGQVTVPVVHLPTGLRFRLVPGGRFEMGLTEEDLENGSEVMVFTAEIARFMRERYASSLPTRLVEVTPFLCCEGRLSLPQLERLGLDSEPSTTWIGREEALTLAHRNGYRLPSEAELEWLARDGHGHAFLYNWPLRKVLEEDTVEQKSVFGFTDLHMEIWAADDWHPTYEGAPSTAEPWMGGGDPEGVFRFGIEWKMQAHDTYEYCFSAIRRRGSPRGANLRPALDVPAELHGFRLG